MLSEKKRWYDYAGAIHVHSACSPDGTTPLEDIIASARRQGLDFIVVTDHFTLEARQRGWERWHDGVLAIVAEEISPRYNHYLAFGLTETVAADAGETRPQSYIDAVERQGGFGLIAHPDHAGAPRFGVKDYPWKDWTATGYAGMSIWDLMTDWQGQIPSLPRALWAYLFPAWSLKGPKSETLRRWDELNRARRVAGFGEIDNHNTAKRFGGFTARIFPFDYAFSTIRTHIFTEEPLSADDTVARAQVFDAIRACRLYVAQERWNPAKGFSCWASDGERAISIGGELRRSGKVIRCEARLPEGTRGRLRLVAGGKPVAEARERLVADIRDAGEYRVEAEQRMFGTFKPWIYSNPFRVL